MIIILILVFIFSACWGSFLNVIAYRSITDKPFFQKRSTCNFCKKTIYWYDNFPVISWFFLKRKCRFCNKNISVLYPLIEILSGVIFTLLFFKIFFINETLILTKANIINFIGYLIFFSSLIVSTRTDLEKLVIPQIFTLWLVPLGIALAYLNYLDILFFESLLGSFLGFFGLLLVSKIFKFFAKKEGLGLGDMELLALIGTFLGPIGVWFSVAFGSFLGILIAGVYIVLTKKDKNFLIPFGPFLALGAIIYYFFKDFLY